MTTPTFLIGTEVVSFAECRAVAVPPDHEGALTDPTTLVFKVRLAGAAATSYTFGVDANVTKTSTGMFKCVIPTIVTATAGTYYVSATGSGTVAAVEDSTFYMKTPNTT